MPKKRAQVADTSTLLVNVHDGTRQLMSAETPILYRVIDGNQK